MSLANLIPVKVSLVNGQGMIRAVPNLEHSTLCRAFSLDPCSTWFDLPSTFRGTGSASGLTSSGGRREVDGLVFQGPKGSEPIGKIKITYEGDRDGFRHDDDPFNRSDFFNLGR